MAEKKPVKIRKRWRINPKTRVKKSNKVYRRPKAKSKFKKDLKAVQRKERRGEA